MSYTASSPWNHIFAKPEPPAWKSPWRIGQERRRSDEMQDRKFIKAPVVVKPAPQKIWVKRPCESKCGADIRASSKSGLCQKCWDREYRKRRKVAA